MDFSTINGLPTCEIQVTICIDLLNRYYHVFENSRRAHRSCITILDLILRHERDIASEEKRIFHKSLWLFRYLGHVVRPSCLKVSTGTIDANSGVKDPAIVTELRSKLRLWRAFCSFVLYFTSVAIPLIKRLRKGHLQTCDGLASVKTTACETLEMQLLEPRVLAVPRTEGAYIVEMDACDMQVGRVLPPMQPDETYLPVRYWSRSSNDADRA